MEKNYKNQIIAKNTFENSSPNLISIENGYVYKCGNITTIFCRSDCYLLKTLKNNIKEINFIEKIKKKLGLKYYVSAETDEKIEIEEIFSIQYLEKKKKIIKKILPKNIKNVYSSGYTHLKAAETLGPLPHSYKIFFHSVVNFHKDRIELESNLEDYIMAIEWSFKVGINEWGEIPKKKKWIIGLYEKDISTDSELDLIKINKNLIKDKFKIIVKIESINTHTIFKNTLFYPEYRWLKEDYFLKKKKK